MGIQAVLLWHRVNKEIVNLIPIPPDRDPSIDLVNHKDGGQVQFKGLF